MEVDGLQGLTTEQDRTQLWNAMIHPFLPMTIYGVLWDQGQSRVHMLFLLSHIYMQTYTCMHTSMHVHTHMCTHHTVVHMSTMQRDHIHIVIPTHTHTLAHMSSIHTCMHVCTYKYPCHTHHTHTHAHAHTHTHMSTTHMSTQTHAQSHTHTHSIPSQNETF